MSETSSGGCACGAIRYTAATAMAPGWDRLDPGLRHFAGMPGS